MANPTICSIPECNKQARPCGWCNAHYRRWLRHGNPLGGRTPVGVPFAFLEEKVLPFKGDQCLLWPYNRHDYGYGMIHMGKPVFVHRISCEHANGPAPTAKHEAAHLCGNGRNGCVNPRHLAWKTHVENKADELIHGTRNRGERQGISKLTECDVREIRSSADAGKTLAVKFNVSKSRISDIRNGKSWTHLF